MSLDEVLARRTKKLNKELHYGSPHVYVDGNLLLFQMIKYASLGWLKQLNLFNERNHFYDITLPGENCRFGSCVWVCWHFWMKEQM